jgi:hypothetical protein
MTSISRISAFLLLAVIAFATLSPVQMRPHLGNPNFERALAYILFGLAMGLGFPNRVGRTLAFVVAVAAVLELMQIFDPGRHARFADGSLKAMAGMLGIITAQFILVTISRYWPRRC